MEPCDESVLNMELSRRDYNFLQMKWCMEESRDFGFNPFVRDVERLKTHGPHVYIAHDAIDNLIKIGTSGNYVLRLKSIGTQKRRTLNLLGMMQGGHSIERQVHKLFSGHLANGREWFHPHQDILDFVQEYTFKPD